MKKNKEKHRKFLFNKMATRKKLKWRHTRCARTITKKTNLDCSVVQYLELL